MSIASSTAAGAAALLKLLQDAASHVVDNNSGVEKMIPLLRDAYLRAFPPPDLASTLRKAAQENGATIGVASAGDKKESAGSGKGVITKKEREKMKDKERIRKKKQEEEEATASGALVVRLSSDDAIVARKSLTTIIAAAVSASPMSEEAGAVVMDVVASVVSRLDSLAAKKAFAAAAESGDTAPPDENNHMRSLLLRFVPPSPLRPAAFAQGAADEDTVLSRALQWVRCAALLGSSCREASRQLSAAPTLTATAASSLTRASVASLLVSHFFDPAVLSNAAAAAAAAATSHSSADTLRMHLQSRKRAEIAYYAFSLFCSLVINKTARLLLTDPSAIHALLAYAASVLAAAVESAKAVATHETAEQRRARLEEEKLIAQALKGIEAEKTRAAARDSNNVGDNDDDDYPRSNWSNRVTHADLAPDAVSLQRHGCHITNGAAEMFCAALRSLFTDTTAAATRKAVLQGWKITAKTCASDAADPLLVVCLAKAGIAACVTGAATFAWADLADDLISDDSKAAASGKMLLAQHADFAAALHLCLTSTCARAEPLVTEQVLRLLMKITGGNEAAKRALCTETTRDALIYVSPRVGSVDGAVLWVQVIINLISLGNTSAASTLLPAADASAPLLLLLGGREIFATESVTAAFATEIGPLVIAQASRGNAARTVSAAAADDGASAAGIGAVTWLVKAMLKITTPVSCVVAAELAKRFEQHQRATGGGEMRNKACSNSGAAPPPQCEETRDEYNFRVKMEEERRRLDAVLSAREKTDTTGRSCSNIRNNVACTANLAAIYADPNTEIARPFVTRDVANLLLCVAKFISLCPDDLPRESGSSLSSKVTELLAGFSKLLDRLSAVFESSSRKPLVVAAEQREFIATGEWRNAVVAIASRKINPDLVPVAAAKANANLDSSENLVPLAARASSLLIALNALIRCDAAAARIVGGTACVREEVLRCIVRLSTETCAPSSENAALVLSIAEYLTSTGASGVKLFAASTAFVNDVLLHARVAGAISGGSAAKSLEQQPQQQQQFSQSTAVALQPRNAICNFMSVAARCIAYAASDLPKKNFLVDPKRTVAVFLRYAGLIVAARNELPRCGAATVEDWGVCLGTLLTFDAERRRCAAESDDDDDNQQQQRNAQKLQPQKQQPCDFVAALEIEGSKIFDAILTFGEAGCFGVAPPTIKVCAALINSLTDASNNLRAIFVDSNPAFRDRVALLFIKLVGTTPSRNDANGKEKAATDDNSNCPFDADSELLFVWLRLLSVFLRRGKQKDVAASSASSVFGANTESLLVAVMRAAQKNPKDASEVASSSAGSAWIAVVTTILSSDPNLAESVVMSNPHNCALVVRMQKQSNPGPQQQNDWMILASERLQRFQEAQQKDK